MPLGTSILLDDGSGDDVLIQDGGNARFAAQVHTNDVVEHAPLMT